jgi:zinc/manganese transport system substrate-binding protein
MLCRAILAFATALVTAATATAAPAAPQRILAAENVYGQAATALAPAGTVVTSVLSNPAQDPHSFEPGASTARAAATAGIAIVNGGGYDPWMLRLLAASPSATRSVIDVARLMRAAPGANPHFWYDPATMPRVAQAVAAALMAHDPAATTDINRRLAQFLAGTSALQARIDTLRARFAGAAVTATEPVFDPMAAALGLTMRDRRFQLAIMNGTEPRPSDVAAMESDLRQRRVRVLIFNEQVASPAAARLKSIAAAAGIALIGVTETQPKGLDYAAWMNVELDALARALASPR